MKVTAPVEGFSGTVAGVEFVDGAGETDSANAVNYFRRHGYELGEAKAAAKPSEDSNPKPAKKAAAKKAAAKPSEQ